MQGWAAHPLDDLLANDDATHGLLFRRALFGKHNFKNRAMFEAFAEAQRTLYDTLGKAGRERQRELLIKLCDTGKYPPLPAPLKASGTLKEFLTPAKRTERIGARTYLRFGAYLVHDAVLDDFITAHEYLAQSCEDLVSDILGALREGGPDGQETRLIDNQEWNTAFLMLPDAEGRHAIQWDRRMMIYDRNGSIIPAPLLLLHEEQTAVERYNDPVGSGVLYATPSKEYGNHLTAVVIRGIERKVMEALRLVPRNGFHGIIVGAARLTSTSISLGLARGKEDFQRAGEHQTTGHVVGLQRNELAIADAEGTIFRYDVRELSNFMGKGVNREKYVSSTLKILEDARIHGDVISIEVREGKPPVYKNPGQTARNEKNLAQAGRAQELPAQGR